MISRNKLFVSVCVLSRKEAEVEREESAKTVPVKSLSERNETVQSTGDVKGGAMLFWKNKPFRSIDSDVYERVHVWDAYVIIHRRPSKLIISLNALQNNCA